MLTIPIQLEVLYKIYKMVIIYLYYCDTLASHQYASFTIIDFILVHI